MYIATVRRLVRISCLESGDLAMHSKDGPIQLLSTKENGRCSINHGIYTLFVFDGD